MKKTGSRKLLTEYLQGETFLLAPETQFEVGVHI